MSIFLSAGHHFAPAKPDPGAIGNNYKENELTRELRGLIANELNYLGAVVILDKDTETLGEYIGRIKPGGGSVVCELHFNASGNVSATGTECIFKAGADLNSRQLAGAISGAVARVCGIVDRGAKDETTSHRGRLGILHTAAGISCLPEICFISNKEDMARYQANKKELAKEIAKILLEYDAKKV